MRKFIVMLIALMVTPTVLANHAGKSYATRTQPLAQFNHVVVQGSVNVNMHTGYRQPKLTLYGDPRDLAQVFFEVKDQRLIINLGAGFPRYGNVSADIESSELNAFVYHGAGVVKGMKLYSRQLDLEVDNTETTTFAGDIYVRSLKVKGAGSLQINGVRAVDLKLEMSGHPKVQLVGMANLCSLDLKGEGMFSMYWVKSDRLRIRAQDDVFLQLAGVANQLEVKLCDRARFNGRYLRAKRLFVKTFDHSLAEVTAVKHQHTLASDASDIYFYNIPDTKTDFMAYNGAVLDLRPWNSSPREEYTVYNKQ